MDDLLSFAYIRLVYNTCILLTQYNQMFKKIIKKKNKESNESLNACKITVVAIKRLKRVFPFVLLSPMPFAINRVLSPPISAR